MKKVCIIFLLSIIISLVAVLGTNNVGMFGFAGLNTQTVGAGTEFLRIHIRANSNTEQDQKVKYLVRDKLVEYLTPVVAECESKSQAKAVLLAKEHELSFFTSRILRENGYDYGGQAIVKRENFPTRVYEDVTLSAGEYDALIVLLGSGKGDNWWCVVYPPLCFSGGKVTSENVVYKSKIAEIIKAWKEKSEE